MARIEFTLDGQRHVLDEDIVRSALRGQTPGRIQVHAVDVDGTLYPVKQALASALRIPTSRFISTRAVDLLRKVGLPVIDTELQPPGSRHERPARGTVDRDTRERALSFAIAHVRATPDLSVDDVLGIASRYAAWLAQ